MFIKKSQWHSASSNYLEHEGVLFTLTHAHPHPQNNFLVMDSESGSREMHLNFDRVMVLFLANRKGCETNMSKRTSHPA